MEAVHSVESLSFLTPQVRLLPTNITCISPHSVQPPLYLGIKLDLVKLLPPACVLISTISNKTFWFWTPAYYFWPWKMLFASCFFLFLGSAAVRVDFLSYSWFSLSKTLSTYFLAWGFRQLLTSLKIELWFLCLFLLVAWDNFPGEDGEDFTMFKS